MHLAYSYLADYPRRIHLHKKHWNDVKVDGSIPEDEILELIDHSYDQVVKGLTRAQRAALQSQT
ncbi:MAG: hypothetical protein GC204_11275 [Chloroflexi bacterium]|nr:hypothetical protein [Chloroflexota bacterium]